MGMYEIPRNVKGEGRILMIFSLKSLLWTAGGAACGYIFYLFFKMLTLGTVGLIVLGIFALIGFAIGTCKMPAIETIKMTRQTEGEYLDDVIKRAIKFKLKKNRIYVYAKEEKEDDIK